MNKELLEIKKQMQGARNILKDLQGIQTIHLYEPGEGTIAQIKLEKMGVLSGYKEPDMVREYNETYQAVADFLKWKTGLGLAIVKHIVELHDAQITVESEPGKGTMMKVTF